MALNWKWEDIVGEIEVTQTAPKFGERKYTLTLYQGNAELIMLNMYTDEAGRDMYDMFGFFVDRDHMKNCLGITKGYDNIYNDEITKLTKLKIKKTVKDFDMIIKCFAKAFDNITIEIYS